MTDPLFGIGTWFAHAVFAILVGVGLFVLVDDDDLVKKVVGLNIFQTGVFLFFVTSAYRADGKAPLITGPGPYVNPLPHVLILTAIVVGVAVTAVALALVVRIYGEYGTLREDVIREVRDAERARDSRARTDGGGEGSSATGGGEGSSATSGASVDDSTATTGALATDEEASR
jgi:multicomponent Na+:H+ antiporter subunit C